MHYLSFINEDPKNKYNDFDCRNCPCFIQINERDNVEDKYIFGTCRFTNGIGQGVNTEIINSIRLEPSINGTCPVKYRDPLVDFNYFQIKSMLTNSWFNSYKESTDPKNDEETKRIFEEKVDKTRKCIDLLAEIFPNHEEKYNKIRDENYLLDDNMNLYK